MHAQLFDQLHSDWQEVLTPHKDLISSIQAKIQDQDFAPARELIFRALNSSITSTKVVIFGQDPYPTLGHAHGLAFSVDASVKKVPPSLRNIYKELSSDIGQVDRSSGDLSDWAAQGVLLLNRVLTTEVGKSMAHLDLGWQTITETVAHKLGQENVVAILWGKPAGELRRYFREEFIIESAHPSPLAAYRGFFGSQPFSRCNSILEANGIQPIRW